MVSGSRGLGSRRWWWEEGCKVCLLMLTLCVSSPLPAPARKLPPKRAEGDIKPYSSSDRECKTGVGWLLGLGAVTQKDWFSLKALVSLFFYPNLCYLFSFSFLRLALYFPSCQF